MGRASAGHVRIDASPSRQLATIATGGAAVGLASQRRQDAPEMPMIKGHFRDRLHSALLGIEELDLRLLVVVTSVVAGRTSTGSGPVAGAAAARATRRPRQFIRLRLADSGIGPQATLLAEQASARKWSRLIFGIRAVS
jgi:hypothetical protein